MNVVGLLACLLAVVVPAPHDAQVPRYAHVFVIMEENKDFSQIMDPTVAPTIARLSRTYGSATQFFGEVHPSEANYVALLGGDTFGIHDDDAYFCVPGQSNPECQHALEPGYAAHTVDQPNLGTQLAAVGLTWKGYYEDLPAPGSMVTFATPSGLSRQGFPAALYASKHNGFINFASTQRDPERARHLVGFDAFDADLASGNVPTFALVVPNQCNEMHGMHGTGIPPGCDGSAVRPLIQRGDAEIDALTKKIMASSVWKSSDNVAIVISWDEDSGTSSAGCCGNDPKSVANFGGGHIPTIVVTNHGPRGVADPTPYNHYSLLRTLEDAFGIATHLQHANDVSQGVVPMVPLFQVVPSAK
jgi:phosphatidylinositol-3-phosphatase